MDRLIKSNFDPPYHYNRSHLTHYMLEEVESQLTRLTPGRDHCAIINVSETGSRLINELNYLANYCVRVEQGHPKNVNGHVLFGNNSYGASLGRYSGFNTRPNIRNNYRLYRDHLSYDDYSKFSVYIPRSYSFISSHNQRKVNQQRKIPERDILQYIDDIKQRILRLKEENIYIGVLSLELLSSDRVLSVDQRFLLLLSVLLKNMNIYLVVDDILSGIRCGEVFSYILFENFKPDFVVIGKAFLFGMIVAINKNKDKELLAGFYKFGGFPTCAIDSMVIRKTIEILNVIKSRRLLNNVKRIGRGLEECLSNMCQQYNEDSLSGQIAIFGGVGCIWFTNLNVVSDAVPNPLFSEFGRLLPYITISENILPRILKSSGSLKDFYNYELTNSAV